MKKMPLFEAITITSLLFAAMGQKLPTPFFHTKIAGDVPSRLDAKMSGFDTSPYGGILKDMGH